MCNKVPFDTKREANQEIKLIKAGNKFRNSRAQKKSGRKMAPYYCKRCDNWHLTTMPKSVTRNFKRSKPNEIHK